MNKIGLYLSVGAFLCAVVCGAQTPGAWAEKTLLDVKSRETYPVIQKEAGTSFTLDGRLDEWKAAPGCRLSLLPAAAVSSPAGLADLNAFFQAMWDTQGLYLAVTVTDDNLSFSSKSSEELWANDSVELFFGPDPEGRPVRSAFTEEDVQILMCPLGLLGAGASSNVWFSPQGFKGSVEFAAARLENGYVLEGKISFPEAMSKRLRHGAFLGFNLAVNDCDQAVWESQFRWFPYGRASADARSRNRLELIGSDGKARAGKPEAWQFGAGTLRSFYLAGETATVYVAGNEGLEGAVARVVFINDKGGEESLAENLPLAGARETGVRVPGPQAALFAEGRFRVQAVSGGKVMAAEEWPVMVADADAMARECASCVRQAAGYPRMSAYVLRALTAPPLADAAAASNLVADLRTVHDALAWAEKVKRAAPPSQAAAAGGRSYAFDKVTVAVEAPVEVGSATGHYWFSSLHPASDSDMLCEAVRGADEAQGEWPAALHLSRDGGRTWSKAMDIECYGPVSHILEPGKVLLMPYETWPLTPDDKRNARARGTLLSCSKDGSVGAERVAMKFLGLPEDMARIMVKENVQTALYVNGNILDIGGGKLFVTLYGKFAGDRTANLYAFESADRGLTWQYVATLARGKDYPFAYDGPSESNSALLPDGRILCVYRMGPVRPHFFYKSYSADKGRTWSKPARVEGAWSVEPQLVCLENGALLLSGGRPGLYLWVCPEGDGNRWEKIDVAEHHNAMIADVSRHYVHSVHDGRQPEYLAGQSTAYTGMKAIGPDTALLSYDRLANGWGGAPGPWGEKDTVYSVRIKVVKK